MEPDTPKPRPPRVRKVDWRRVLDELAKRPAGTPVLVAELDQSVRTHIRQGRYSYIDPAKYDVWSEHTEGTRALIYMSRRP